MLNFNLKEFEVYSVNNLIGLTSREIYEIKENAIRDKILLYRQKPDVMNEELLGIKQNIYQRVAIRSLFHYDYNAWVWSRGLGKSWTAGLAAIDMAMLYPKMVVGIAAPSFRQAKMIIENKIMGDFVNRSEILRGEIKDVKNNNDHLKVILHNGSEIIAFPVGTDGSKIRGLRLQLVIIDEYAQMNKTIVDRVIKPMLAVKSGYEVGKTDYSDSAKNRMLFTSSAYFKFNHLYQTIADYGKAIGKGSKEHFVYPLNYRVGLETGLFDQKFIDNERNTQTTIDFDMEYGAKFIDLSEDNWISPTDLEACSTMNKVQLDYDPKYKYVMGLDVARVSGNDNTSIHVLKLVDNVDHYIKENVYSYTMNGETFGVQTQRIREILNRYPVNRIYMDTTGLGVGLADELSKPYFNVDTNEIDPPLCDVNNKEHLEIKDGNFIIHGQKFSNDFNYRMAVSTKKNTQKRRLRLYAPETEGVYSDTLSYEEVVQIKEAHKTRIEVMSIEATPKGNFMSFNVPRGGISEGRKDRWTSLSLALFGADEMELEDFRDEEDEEFVPMASIKRRDIY